MCTLRLAYSTAGIASVAASALLSGCGWFEDLWNLPTADHSVEHVEGPVERLWIRERVFTQEDINGQIEANEGILVLAGSLDPESVGGLFAFDTQTGTSLWERKRSGVRELELTKDAVIVGETSGGVTKYSLSSGDYIWQRDVSGGAILSMYANDSEIQLFAHPSRFHILDASSGRMIQSMKSETPIYMLLGDRFIEGAIQASQVGTKDLIWRFETMAYPRSQSPIFAAGNVYFRDKQMGGSIWALDTQTGEIKWRRDDTAISNLADSERLLFYLTKDGDLHGADLSSGELVIRVKFDGSASFSTLSGYHVAFDRRFSVLVVALGDSAELYAFRVDHE